MKSLPPTTVVGALALLPSQVSAHGRNFVLSIFCDYHPQDIRAGYVLDGSSNEGGASAGSWQNPYAGGATQSFLVLKTGIASDSELLDALVKLHYWLVGNGLLDTDFDLR